jgi:dTDP-glucose 4,6-dehydratase
VVIDLVYLITGGAGFIGSAVARMLATGGETVVVLDKLTYAADLRRLDTISDSGRLFFEQADICDGAAVARIFAQYAPVAILHLAAESHVDRSIDGPASFVRSNILGTYELLHRAVEYWRGLAEPLRRRFRFVHVSTDEVYGALGPTGMFTENTPFAPNSPYAASKAAADHLARAWYRTYGLPVIVTNCSNNYGPYQFPEKLVPTVISAALGDRPIPVYGRGENIRDWIHVEDHARALLAVAREGRPGERYNIGAAFERRNIDFVREICAVLDRHAPRHDNRSYADQISFVADRPGHDFRYALDASKIRSELGWSPREQLPQALEQTVSWYLQNRDWLLTSPEPNTAHGMRSHSVAAAIK